MRYLIIRYFRRPNGQMDEIVEISTRTRNGDLQSASVILDFQKRQVVKCSLDGVVVPKNWQRIRDFYHQHYADVIDRLEKNNGQTPDID